MVRNNLDNWDPTTRYWGNINVLSHNRRKGEMLVHNNL